MKRITGICIITDNVPRLRDFYRDVFQVEPEGDERFSTFMMDGGQLSLCDVQIMEQMAPNSTANMGHGCYTLEVKVEDVDVEYQRLIDLCVPIVKPPTTQPWGLRSVWFQDPGGNVVNFYCKVKN